MTEEIKIHLSDQEKDVLEYIRDHGAITHLEAVYALGCARLSARVFDLREKGVNIQRELIPVLNRRGHMCYVARYYVPGGIPGCFSA